MESEILSQELNYMHLGIHRTEATTQYRTLAGDDYTCIADVKPGSVCVNIIAIVTYIGPVKRSKNNDLSRSLTIVDPFDFDTSRSSNTRNNGALLNCFSEKYLEWLPSPNINDVIILRGAKLITRTFNGQLCFVGYKDYLQWAIYDRHLQSIHYGDRGVAPDAEALGNGLGRSFSPLYKTVGTAEVGQCMRLLSCWEECLSTTAAQLGAMHDSAHQQLDGGAVLATSVSSGRKHRLISEASPDIEPQGFMDCTVEVVSNGGKSQMNNGVRCVFVTDYSPNPVIGDHFSTPELSDRAMLVELSDGAIDLVQAMACGSFWFLRNLRVKLGNSGLWEGRLREQRGSRQLSASDTSQEPYLQELLGRKNALLPKGGGIRIYPPKSLSYGLEDDFFSCTVEVVRVNCDAIPPYILITDYIHDSPLVVVLSRGQITMCESIEAGDFYDVSMLRLQWLPSTGRVRGRLGGDETLLIKLDPVNANAQNKHLKPLLGFVTFQSKHWMTLTTAP